MRTLGVVVFALMGQEPATSAASSTLDILTLLREAHWVEQAVMFVLLLFSAISWGVIVFKYRQLGRASKQNAQFLSVFRKSSRFSEVQASCGALPASSLVGLFQSGYAELTAQMRTQADGRPGESAGRPTLRSMEGVDRALLRASTTELSRLEHRIAFLATTASITPYIGLFGTVLGIVSAFTAIAESGSSSLAVVAPGIASALIATAAGLFAAIPAVYFYNDLTSRVKGLANEMEDFSLDFLTIAERNFT